MRCVCVRFEAATNRCVSNSVSETLWNRTARQCFVNPFTSDLMRLFGAFLCNFSRAMTIVPKVPKDFTTNDDLIKFIKPYFEVGVMEGTISSAQFHISMQSDWIGSSGKDFLYRITQTQYNNYGYLVCSCGSGAAQKSFPTRCPTILRKKKTLLMH